MTASASRPGRAYRYLAAGLGVLVWAEITAAAVLSRVVGWTWRDALDAFVVTNGVMGLSFATCGSIIAWHRARNPIGWLFLGSGVAQATTAVIAPLAQVLVEGARLGLDLGDRQLLDRYQRWRSLDSLMVAMATDGLTRIYGIPGRTASAIRRFGMGVIDRVRPLSNQLMSEARGTSGDLPLLLRGLPI